MGRYVGKYHVLVQVILDDVRQVGIHGLVVCNAGPGCISERYPAITVNIHQARYPEGRVGAECFGVDKIIIDPAVNHIYALKAPRCAHMDEIVHHDQIASFHQFDTHLLRQVRMLEIGRVVHARRQHHDRGI
jgi:hypothetical protein